MVFDPAGVAQGEPAATLVFNKSWIVFDVDAPSVAGWFGVKLATIEWAPAERPLGRSSAYVPVVLETGPLPRTVAGEVDVSLNVTVPSKNGDPLSVTAALRDRSSPANPSELSVSTVCVAVAGAVAESLVVPVDPA